VPPAANTRLDMAHKLATTVANISLFFIIRSFDCIFPSRH